MLENHFLKTVGRALVTCLLWIGMACANMVDLREPSAERNVRVLAEDLIKLNFINEFELADDHGRIAYVEPGDLEIYIDVKMGSRVAHNMGVTVSGQAGRTVLICAGHRLRLARPAGFQLTAAQASKLSQIGKRALCDALTRR